MEKIISRRSELEELRFQAGQITDESLESTRRMLSMMEESEEAGRRTIEGLDIQSEQLKRIENGMDHINADMTKAERSLSSLKRCCNICAAVPWKKVPSNDESEMHHKNEANKNSKIIVDQPQGFNGIKRASTSIPTNASNGYVKRITNDAREDEMESNLCQVDSIVGSLRNMAVDMNSELSRHNEQIERINRKGDANTMRLEQANNSANDLLNS